MRGDEPHGCGGTRRQWVARRPRPASSRRPRAAPRRGSRPAATSLRRRTRRGRAPLGPQRMSRDAAQGDRTGVAGAPRGSIAQFPAGTLALSGRPPPRTARPRAAARRARSVPSPGGLSTLSVPSQRADAVGEAAEARARAGVARRRRRRRGPRRRARRPRCATRTVACVASRVLGDVRQRLGDREVRRRLDRRRRAGRRAASSTSTGTGARAASAAIAGARPRSVSTAGWMPRASSRSSADASASSSPRRSRNGAAARGSLLGRARARGAPRAPA